MVKQMQTNVWKWTGAILLAMMMALVFIPSSVHAAKADDITVYMTVNDKGVIAEANDGSAMAWKEVTVEDLDESGDFTYDEALVAAHKAYNSPDGYNLSGGATVNKLWGVSTTNTLFFVNGNGLPTGVGVDKVTNEDHLLASINADENYYSDWIAKFDKYETVIEKGESVDLTLTGHLGMAYEEADKQFVPLKDIQIGTWENGAFKAMDGIKTDVDGKATVSFDKPGVYVVTAQGTTKGTVTDWNMMGITHDDEGEPVYGWMDFTTYDCTMAYTDTDYKEGPYPADEILKTEPIGLFDLGDFDFTDFDGYFLRNNTLAVDAPLMAPVCIVRVKADPIDVTVTVNDKGVIAKSKDGSPVAGKKVTVQDENADGKLTYNEALVQAHKEFCPEGEGGFGVTGSGWVTKMWGYETGNAMFFTNDKTITPSLVIDAEIKDGDDLYASANADDAYYADVKTAFDKKTEENTCGDTMSISITGFKGMGYTDDELTPKPLEGIQIGYWDNGQFKPISGAVTDKDGKATFKMPGAGKYLLTAKGTVKMEVEDYSDWPDVKQVTVDCPTTAPYCWVNVIKGTPEVTAPKTVSRTYNGKNQTLITAGSTTGGTLVYSTDGKSWSTSLPAKTNAATYTVYYKVNGNNCYNPVAAKTLKATIAKKPVTITAKNQNVQMGGNISKTVNDVATSGLVAGHKLQSVNIAGSSSAKLTNSGKIAPSGAKIVSGKTDVTANYKITYKKGTLVVNPVESLVACGTAKGRNAVTITWNKLSSADRYVIYMARCGAAKDTKVGMTGAKATSFSKTGLSKNQSYRFVVVAEKKSGKSYKQIKKSYYGHFVTGNSKGSMTNPKSMKLNKTSFALKKGQSANVTATVTKVKANKKLMTNHAKLLRYQSSDSRIASVDAKGKITAKRAGACKIYVQTINGMWRTAVVVVK